MKASIGILGVLTLLAVLASDYSPTEPRRNLASAMNREASGGQSTVARVLGRPRQPLTLDPRRRSTPALLGAWAGDHIRLTVDDKGALIVFDCASGSIDTSVVTDALGRFSLAGHWLASTPIPPAAGYEPHSFPAIYSGVVNGNTMMLTITVSFSGTLPTPETFTLVKNAAGRLVFCS